MPGEIRFAPASRDEQRVFGACRPGYNSFDDSKGVLTEWLRDVKAEGIDRVCCLLGEDELEQYDGLLESYEKSFGPGNVLHSPITDFTTVDATQFHNDILPFLKEAATENESVVVHCSAGMGRTGHILVLWLAVERGFTLEEAIQEVQDMGRSPLEAASQRDLQSILNASGL